ncbi:hypothetical protein BC629DRAFT_74292 [Irpex lacteus]|nr:hypothetical protein BC629DRAFT_74292 [Irpex lacteus]
MSDEGYVLSCGSISTMTSPYEMKNYDQVFKRKLIVQGFVCYAGPMAKPMETFFQDVVPLILDGSISHREHLYHGMEEAARALCDVHTGANTGKAVVVVRDE